MAILIIIATLILIDITVLVIRNAGGSHTAPVGADRFRGVALGRMKTEEKPRATGLDYGVSS